MCSNLPDGGAGTNQKKSLSKVTVNLEILHNKKNLVNLQFMRTLSAYPFTVTVRHRYITGA